jgi:glycosyltransferase involved in cell wall biosynthesis
MEQIGKNRRRDYMPKVSVIMPTYKQAAFISRAISSLLNQSYTDWELLIVDDGSPDDTRAVVLPYLDDIRIRYYTLPENRGMAAALNVGMSLSSAPLVAYLPSDDVFYPDHLGSLVETLEANHESPMAYSGVRYHYNRSTAAQIPGYPLQLVQVMHRRSDQRWVERSELVTDDLDRMYWSKLGQQITFIPSGQITCEWVDHPLQRHKILREPLGGINPYRLYYGVKEPLRFHTRVGNFIDEKAYFKPFRDRPPTPPAANGLKILLVGELAYNSERVLALEELGHRLYGLWLPQPYWYNSVGPLPFGHVEDLPQPGWQEAVKKIKPDIVYALLNWQAVPFAHQVMQEIPDIPFVWHFKEGPFICLEKGSWAELVDLYQHSDGQIYCSPEMRDWTETAIPGSVSQGFPYVLDGDLPKRDYLEGERSPRISERQGEVHTVVPGRPIGLHPADVKELSEWNIHLHFYGDFTQGQWLEWIDKVLKLAPQHIHLHANVDQRRWVSEFSQYDAGWLHYFNSENHGDLSRANWDDLNYPARISTLVSAGLPMLQYDNDGSIVASQTLARQLDIGFFFIGMEDLYHQLSNPDRLAQVRENVWRNRDIFTFDYHAAALVEYFREVISRFGGEKRYAQNGALVRNTTTRAKR